MKKIIHVAKHPMTGVWTSMFNLAKSQAKAGHEVYIYLCVMSDWPFDYSEQLKKSGIVFKIDYFPRFKLSYLLLFFKSRLANFCKPLLVHDSKRLVLHFHNAEFSAVFLRYWMLSSKVKIVTTFHGMPGIDEKFKKRRWFQKLLFRILCHFESSNVCVDTKSIDDGFNILGYDKRYFSHIPNGIILQHFERNSEPILFDKKYDLVCSFVGSIDDNKGWDLIIDAITAVRRNGLNVCLLIAGDGYMKSQLLEKIYDLEYIKYLGKVSNVYSSVYQYSDVNIMASKNEGMPMVLLECFNFNIPIISTDTGAFNEFFGLGFHMIKTDRDVLSISEAIIFYNDLPISSKIEKIKLNKILLSNYFDIDSIVKKYDEKYDA